MTVAAAARAAGVSSKAVRLWEAEGLGARTSAGYRIFTDDDVVILRCIRAAKALNLSLAEIRRILDLQRGETVPGEQLATLLVAQIAEVDQTIAKLLGCVAASPVRSRLPVAARASPRIRRYASQIIESAAKAPD